MAVNQVEVKSPMASAMGAKISVTGPGRGMYLVIGRESSPEKLVNTAGGQVVLRLNGRKLLVTLPFIGYLSLKTSPIISHIGPISVDVKRLNQVIGLLSKKLNK